MEYTVLFVNKQANPIHFCSRFPSRMSRGYLINPLGGLRSTTPPNNQILSERDNVVYWKWFPIILSSHEVLAKFRHLHRPPTGSLFSPSFNHPPPLSRPVHKWQYIVPSTGVPQSRLVWCRKHQNFQKSGKSNVTQSRPTTPDCSIVRATKSLFHTEIRKSVTNSLKDCKECTADSGASKYALKKCMPVFIWLCGVDVYSDTSASDVRCTSWDTQGPPSPVTHQYRFKKTKQHKRSAPSQQFGECSGESRRTNQEGLPNDFCGETFFLDRKLPPHSGIFMWYRNFTRMSLSCIILLSLTLKFLNITDSNLSILHK